MDKPQYGERSENWQPEIVPPAQAAEAAGSAPRQRSQHKQRRGFGFGRSRGSQSVTITLIAVCAIVWLLQFFVGETVTRALWYVPAYSLPQHFEPWRLLTVMFTHSPTSVFHILANMYTLWIFGPQLEQLLGKFRFLALYALSGLGGSLAVLLWTFVDPQSLLTPTVGASGAIFGIIGATLVLYKRLQLNLVSLAVLVGINLVIGFLPGTGISWQAHLGGMLVGALVMWIMMHRQVINSPSKTGAAIAITALLLGAASCIYLFV